MRYPVVVTPDLEEAMTNIRDAIEGCLAVLREKGEPIREPTDALLATVEVAG